MKIIRTFHPIGQGAFYSERFCNNKAKYKAHNIVFDCGVCLGYENSMRHVVNQAFNPDEKIDYLFITHLDYEHVSLAYYLINNVKKIVLPLVSEEQLVIAMIYYQIEGCNNTALFFRAIINRIGRSENKNSVIFIGDDENEDNQLNRKSSGSVIKVPGVYDWALIPYNLHYASHKIELVEALAKVVDDQTFKDHVEREGYGPIKSAEELIENLKNEEFSKKMLVVPVLRRAIKSVYENISRETNENSLILYSGPKSGVERYILERCEAERWWCYYDWDRPACLYTGDSICDINDWRKKYSDVWKRIGTIQLPYHGSVDSFDVISNGIDNRYVFPVSFGTYNTYGHPSGKVLAYLQVCDCCVPMVTELANSVFMELIKRS